MCANTDVTADGGTRPRITDETADRLHDRKRRGETTNDVIARLLDMTEDREDAE